jgi:hypothetical protein
MGEIHILWNRYLKNFIYLYTLHKWVTQPHSPLVLGCVDYPNDKPVVLYPTCLLDAPKNTPCEQNCSTVANVIWSQRRTDVVATKATTTDG